MDFIVEILPCRPHGHQEDGDCPKHARRGGKMCVNVENHAEFPLLSSLLCVHEEKNKLAPSRTNAGMVTSASCWRDMWS